MNVAEQFATRVGRAITAHEFACYALAVLASPRYRTEHDEALRIDYPRIPPPADAPHFERRVRAGERLVELCCAPIGAETRCVRTSEFTELIASMDARLEFE